MIIRQIDALNAIKYKLRELHSLMLIFSSSHNNTSSLMLENGVYFDFGNVISNLILEQKIEIENISSKLEEINNELPVLKKVGESNE